MTAAPQGCSLHAPGVCTGIAPQDSTICLWSKSDLQPVSHAEALRKRLQWMKVERQALQLYPQWSTDEMLTATNLQQLATLIDATFMCGTFHTAMLQPISNMYNEGRSIEDTTNSENSSCGIRYEVLEDSLHTKKLQTTVQLQPDSVAAYLRHRHCIYFNKSALKQLTCDMQEESGVQTHGNPVVSLCPGSIAATCRRRICSNTTIRLEPQTKARLNGHKQQMACLWQARSQQTFGPTTNTNLSNITTATSSRLNVRPHSTSSSTQLDKLVTSPNSSRQKTNHRHVLDVQRPSLTFPVLADDTVITSPLQLVIHILGHEMMHAVAEQLCPQASRLAGEEVAAGHGQLFARLSRRIIGFCITPSVLQTYSHHVDDIIRMHACGTNKLNLLLYATVAAVLDTRPHHLHQYVAACWGAHIDDNGSGIGDMEQFEVLACAWDAMRSASSTADSTYRSSREEYYYNRKIINMKGNKLLLSKRRVVSSKRTD